MKTGMLRAGRHIPPETAAYGKGTPLPMQALRHGMRGNSRPLVMGAAQIPLCRPRTCRCAGAPAVTRLRFPASFSPPLKAPASTSPPGRAFLRQAQRFPHPYRAFFPKPVE